MTKKIKLKISQRLTKKKTRRNGYGAKHCRFCGSDEQRSFLDYKNSSFLRAFLTERGKILPARISGCCSRHQRAISTEIKKSRTMALMPFTAQYF